MEVVKFDKNIFDVLIRCGFRYCYSKTITGEQSTDKVNIFLTPVSAMPDIHQLPFGYDTYFKLTQEPKQMAAGIDNDTDVFINLNNTLIGGYYG